MRELVRQLADAGVQLMLDGDKLRLRAFQPGAEQPYLATVRACRDELVAYLRDKGEGTGNPAALARPPLVAQPRGSRPLAPSFAQQRLWLLDRIDGGSAHYNMPGALRVKGHFNLTVAEQAFARIVARHEVLRTIFSDVGDELVQEVRAAAPFVIAELDLTGVPTAQREQAAHELACADALRPFDLTRDCMLRACFLRCADADGVLLFNLHHIASDGWSMAILVREFLAQYAALSAGLPDPLPPLTLQYADYAQWQRDWLSGAELERQLGYWTGQLADLPPVHGLPLTRPRPVQLGFAGARHAYNVAPGTLSKLHALAQAQQTTLFMVLHGALSVLLARHSGNNDIVLGTPVANRQQAALAPLIGCFVNTLVLRTQVPHRGSFNDFLAHVRTVNLDAQRHQDVPFEALVERLQPERSTQYSPLFQIMFSMEAGAQPDSDGVQLPDLCFHPMEAAAVSAKFELTFLAAETAEGLALAIDYNTELFDATAISRLAEHHAILLRTIAHDSTQPVASLVMQSAAEHAYLVTAVNATAAPLPHGQCVHTLFEQQVIATPEARAAIYGDTSLNYAELNARANQLAHYLMAERGVQADTPVGICLDRSLDMLVALLAILKAGGAYVPLEPDYPSARLAYMQEDAGLATILTRRAVDCEGPRGARETLYLDDPALAAHLARQPDMNPDPARTGAPSADSLAYVIYTSGSTGKPKGVALRHVGVVNYLAYARAAYLEGVAGAIVSSPLAFDATVTSLLAPLTAGKWVELLVQDGREIEQLADCMAQLRTPLLFKITPAHLESLAPYLIHRPPRDLPHMIVVGGEQLSCKVAAQWKGELLPQAVLVNEYGPTETVVGCCTYFLRDILQLAPGQAAVPIGQPLANTQLYVLDAAGNPAPLGVPGELMIGGLGLARGYLNRPELTDERFVVNPFHAAGDPASSTRLYRTGDLARRLPNGDLEYLGRLDDQVKIRGFRIELGEIEAALFALADVAEAVVTARCTPDGARQLVAYVVPVASPTAASDAAPAALADSARRQLRLTLPAYMLPSAYVVLAALPLTSNGKVDKKALPAPDVHASSDAYVAPGTDSERRLAAIWAALLHLQADTIGAHADFFALGGHSLLAVRLVAEVRKQFGIELGIRDVFAAPELASQARLLTVAGARPLRPPIMRQQRQGHALPLSFAQQRLWFLDRLEGGSAHYNMPYALRVGGQFDPDIAAAACAHIVARHEALRTVFVERDDDTVQLVRAPSAFQLPQTDLSHLPVQQREQAARAWADSDAVQPFDLARDTMLRASYVRFGPDDGVLLFNLHHIASDGWSMGVLQREFLALYEALATGQDAALPPLPIQYADYAQWQRQWLTDVELERQLNYWLRQLAGLPAVHGLATDRVRPSQASYDGARHSVMLDADMLRGLRALARQCQATLFMVLHGALSIVLARHSNSGDVIIGTPVANRPQAELEPLIGFFVNTLVLRTTVVGQAPFSDFLEHVKAVNLDAQEHQELPFEALVERLKPVRSTQFSPLFQIVLSMATTTTVANEPLTTSGVQFTALDEATISAKYELAFHASETADGLVLAIDYSTALFDAATIARLANNLQLQLAAVAENPALSITTLPPGFVVPMPAEQPAAIATSAATSAYVPPCGTTEQTIARIWCELLEIEQVGRHDHFFELGGHSLMAVRLASQLRQALGVDAALRELFAFPTLAGMASVVSKATRRDMTSVTVTARNAPLPLSWPQQRLWFLAQLDPAAAAAYHIPLALRLTGALDTSVLKRVLDHLVARHESLRTHFDHVDGEPVQLIAPADCGFALGERDLRALTGHEQEAALQRHAIDETAAPFNLAAGPLVRGQLLRLSDEQHVLLVTQHHIVSDGWSVGVLVREVVTSYAAFLRGEADGLTPLGLQYADYAAWQRNWLQGEVLQQQLAYWRNHLAGAPTLLDLPTDRSRPALQSYAGASVPLVLPAALVDGLRTLSLREGSTVYMCLLAAWSILLARLSGQDELVIGTPVANRQRKEFESLIGLFVNTLPLRIRLTAECSVAELLTQIRATTLDGYMHQDLPFEQMVEALQPVRSMRHTPVFQVMFAFNNMPRKHDVELPGLTLSSIDTPQSTAQLDLMLALDEGPAGIAGNITYASDLFDPDTVSAWAGYLLTILGAMVTDPTQATDRLPLLSAPQRQQLLDQFNATATSYPRERLIHELFEDKAIAQPLASAIVCDGRTMSYGELNTQANRLAHRLIALGVGPNARVAICMERSATMVVALLAILKAGGAYVPLDPDHPPERTAVMLADSSPAALLTQQALAASMPFTGPMLCLDTDTELVTVADETDSNPDPHTLGLTSSHLAYIIFTSGSTGQPKGVAEQHRPAINLIDWVNRRFGVGPGDMLLFTTSLCFDLSVYDLFGTLAAGGTVRVASRAEIADPQRLLAILYAEPITFWDSAPAVFNQLVPFLASGTSGNSKLRLAFFSGDWIPLELPGAVRRAFPHCEVVGLGGATEATVWSNFYPIGEVDPTWRSIPYGKPIQNARYYVLDRHLQPCPIGVAGDLYIGGECLSQGYFGRAQLTAERYLPDPFTSMADARIYRTGDRARYWQDGNLEFLGRSDFQVKIRGFRIELGEIETKLIACDGVRDAVVTAREDTPGDQRLVAYVLPSRPGTSPDPARLREALSRALPRYMVPAAFVVLDAFPLTPNGKLDRQTLPPPEALRGEQDYIAPGTDTEIRLAAIWAEALGLDRVGIHDNFFDLGGHSMLAVLSLEAIRTNFGSDVALQLFFEAPTVAQFAQALEARHSASAPSRSRSRLVWD